MGFPKTMLTGKVSDVIISSSYPPLLALAFQVVNLEILQIWSKTLDLDLEMAGIAGIRRS